LKFENAKMIVGATHVSPVREEEFDMSENNIVSKMCHLKKSTLKDHFDDVVKLVDNPKYICKKCFRVANDKDALCKPKKMRE